ncbi:MAG: cytochrome b/b6 domain-containing protein [Gammaproteobacteria bacterium]|nr:MAG: cytochrome b/b6 domain-containing protein [Gammaproteobacteria bacterium]
MNIYQEVKVWDLFVRVFHWGLVVAFTIAYFTEDDLLDLHVATGYTVLALVLFRILWGFIGTRHARFSDFIKSLAVIKTYLINILLFRAKRYIGHNPTGGAMIVLMLAFLLVTTLTGIAAYHGANEQNVGKWIYELLEEGHEFLANLTLLLVVIHIAGVIVESLMHRENLVRAMFTGRKRAN